VASDEAITHASDLGVPVTTDPNAVLEFLREDGDRVVFSTYQSSPVTAAALTARIPPFDLVVADESHRCVGRVDSDFTTVLDNKRIRARKRLFMTATPRFFTARVHKEAGESELTLASMDDEKTFGPMLHRLDFSEAIKKKLLSDYQVVVAVVTDDEYAEMVAKAKLVRSDGIGDTDARTLARQVTLLKTIRKYDLRRILTFHGRVKSAAAFSRELADVRSWMPRGQRPSAISASYVSGGMNVGERAVRMEALRSADGSRVVMSNARCLAEGVDVPSIDGVAFIDPKRSPVEIIQAAGRAIRLAKEKVIGTIVIPVVIDHGDDPDAALTASNFRHVWDVVNALRAHDDRLGYELDEATKQHWALVALDCAVDTTTPAGEAMANVLATFAQFERRLIGQRTREALAIKKAQGVRIGRPSALSAAVRERIYAEHHAGESLTAIASMLNDEQVPTAQGGRQWWPSTVRSILRAKAVTA
jgi:predicted helicase